jgi:hypothetical protein
LVDEPDGIFARVERDSAIVSGAAANGDVHENKLVAPCPQAIAEFNES